MHDACDVRIYPGMHDDTPQHTRKSLTKEHNAKKISLARIYISLQRVVVEWLRMLSGGVHTR